MTGNNKKGITLLIAVLTSSLLLAITLSIFSITIKELQISASSRESHKAFYAADAGIECALYWDFVKNAFATSTTEVIRCNKQTFPNMGGVDGQSQFTIDFSGNDVPDPASAEVTVNKNPDMSTVIEARGYNTSQVGGRRTERGIRVQY